MSTALYSHPPLADFVLSEANGQMSRENITVLQTGAAVDSGSLLTQNATGTASFAMKPGSAGNPTATDIAIGAAVAGGAYRVGFINDKDFKVFYPNGAPISGVGKIGTKFTSGTLEFKLVAGTDESKTGDEGILNVTAASCHYSAYTGASGTTADAILYSQLHEASGTTPAVAFVRQCEVKRGALKGLTAAAEKHLASKGIIVRDKEGIAGIHTPEL